jgi:hypothetical protein
MLKQRLSLIVTIVSLTLLSGGPIMAQGPGPQHSDPTWRASFWNNRSLEGTPVLTREDTAIDYDWGNGSPDRQVNSDSFSARWTRYLDLAAGTYRFTVHSDDGVRLWVDNTLLINDWTDHAVRVATTNVALSAGHHLVQVEYYENTGLAVIKVAWARASEPTSGWLGEYFNNDVLSGSPVLVRTDPAINFNWGQSTPAPGVDADTFSVRWTQSPAFTAGNYRFTVTADDGVRLWVSDHLLIDEWREQSTRTFSNDIYLPGGNIPIRMEYCELYGLAEARLTTTRLDTTANIVDNTSSSFVKGGSATGWHTQNEGYGGSLLWTHNNDQVRPNYNWARWYPTLAAGRYELFVYIPERYTTTAQARYWVSHRDGFTLRIVDQSANGDRWVSLGTYRFQGNNMDYVSLSDVTYETRMSRLIAFDAVRWEPR